MRGQLGADLGLIWLWLGSAWLGIRQKGRIRADVRNTWEEVWGKWSEAEGNSGETRGISKKVRRKSGNCGELRGNAWEEI